MINIENNRYLKEQLITYIGNKRNLLTNISNTIDEILEEIDKPLSDIKALDLFSGSGVVSRLFKDYGFIVYANDLEKYSHIINECYLSNHTELVQEEYDYYFNKLKSELINNLHKGVISNNYSPANDKIIQYGERAFYTNKNAQIIDTTREFIDSIPVNLQKFFISPLLYEASVHTNTSGVFKGFYKDSKTGIGKFGGNGENALQRITSDIQIVKPILSNQINDYFVYNEDANVFVNNNDTHFDIAYLDPPYNQHPYGSNYFMLNTILENNIKDNISKVSGIPND